MLKYRYLLLFHFMLITFLNAADIKRGDASLEPCKLSEKEISNIQLNLLKSGSLEPVSIYLSKASDLIFPPNCILKWSSDAVLEIQTAGNIIFPATFSIHYSGKGGGLILKPYSRVEEQFEKVIGGTVRFDGTGAQVDFRESRDAAISIYYNPVPSADGNHKYQNPISYDSHVSLHATTYFGCFMLINEPEDVRSIENNPQGQYALSKPIRVDTGSTRNFHYPTQTYYENKAGRILKIFSGRLNYNGFYLLSRKFTNRGTTEEEIFEEALSKDEIWGPCFVFLAPPLYGRYKQLVNFILQRDEERALQLIDDNETQELPKTWLGYVYGPDLQTPLHLAAANGLIKIVIRICELAMVNFTSNKNKGFGVSGLNLIRRLDKNGKFPLLLAAQERHVETTQYLIEFYFYHKILFSQQLIEGAVAQQKTKNEEDYNKILVLVKQQQEKPQIIPPHWVGLPDKTKIREEEYKHAQNAHNLFFLRPPGTMKSIRIFEQFQADYKESKERSVLNVDGLSGRSRILLLKEITQHKLAQLPISLNTQLPVPPGENKYWRYATDRMDESDSSTQYLRVVDILPTSYSFGGAIHTFVNSPTKEKPGYAHYQQIRAYAHPAKISEEDINSKMEKIAHNIHPHIIADLLRQSHVSGQPITSQKLQKAGHNNQATIDHDAHYLNCLNFLLDLEVASRLVRMHGWEISEYDKIPIGVGWCRTQSYILGKKSSYTDLRCFIKPTDDRASEYHLFTSNNAQKRAEAVMNISDLMAPSLQEERKQYPNMADFTKWERDHPLGRIIATPERFHQELLEEYGGGYESEGNDYGTK